MAITGYDKDLVKAFLVERFEEAPRGAAAAIAEEAGITQAPLTRWRRGVDCPLPRYWPIIERHLGLAPGAIAKVAGMPQAAVRREAMRAEINRLSGQLEQIQARLAVLDRSLSSR